MNGTGEGEAGRRSAGLCATCRHAHTQPNAKGSLFWRCGRADDDPGYRRYPPLPVQACPGHEPTSEGGC